MKRQVSFIDSRAVLEDVSVEPDVAGRQPLELLPIFRVATALPFAGCIEATPLEDIHASWPGTIRSTLPALCLEQPFEGLA